MFEFLALFGALSIYSWLVIIAGVCGIMFAVDSESYGFSTLILLVSGVLLTWITGHSLLDPWHAIVNDPSIIVRYVSAYVGVGIAWSIAKWFFFLMRVRDELVTFRSQNDISGPLTDKQRSDAKSYLSNRISSFERKQSIPPRAGDNAGRITFWMLWWPFSMPWTLINEPVKRFFTFVYNRLSGLLQAMSDRLFRGIA